MKVSNLKLLLNSNTLNKLYILKLYILPIIPNTMDIIKEVNTTGKDGKYIIKKVTWFIIL